MRVLILGAGAAPANSYTRALRQADTGYHLIGANTNADHLLLAETDETHLLPPPNEDRDALWQLCQKTRPDFVHAQPEPEILRLSRFRNVVKPARTFLPDHDTILVCQDKWETHLRWKAAGIPQPETHLARGREALFNTIGAVAWKPRWLRKRRGGGGAGALKTDDWQLAHRWIALHDGWGEFTVADVLPGKSVAWTSVWWRGELVASQQRLRVEWASPNVAGVSGHTGVGETCSDPRVDEVAPAAVLAVDRDAHGLFGVDLTYDQHGIPNPTEINAGRFHTTVPEFFARAGWNVAHAYTQMGGGNREVAGHWPARTNPLTDGFRWLRLMDKEPVLVRPDGRAARNEEMSAADRALWNEWYDARGEPRARQAGEELEAVRGASA